MGPNFWGPPGGDRNPTHKFFRIGLPKNTQKFFPNPPPTSALRRPRARAMPSGWRVPPGRTSDAGKPSPLHFRCFRPCGPSIRPPRSPAGRSECVSVETQRLVFACVHETPDSARLQAGIRGTRAFGGIPPRRLLSFHTSKPNRRVSRSPVHSGRSRPSRLRRQNSGRLAGSHPAGHCRFASSRAVIAPFGRPHGGRLANTRRPSESRVHRAAPRSGDR